MGLMKKLTSAIVASSLVFSMVGTAMAAYTPTAGETAGNRMMGLKILNGKYENDPLALKDEITRAELVTVIVRAFGQAEMAASLKGYPTYPDTASHWASGNITMAKILVERAGGDAIGMPDGSFAPDAKLTPAQAVAFLMKFLGVKADANKAWPANYLDVAVEKNLITAEDAALLAPMSNDSATRGLVFYLYDRAFYNYDLGAGATFYTKYVDTSAPVITLNKGEATVLDSKVTITGKVEGATEVYVGSNAVTTDANGNFSFDYNLPELKDYEIVVTAQDLAGNVAEETYAVTRTTGNIATIEAEAITVAAGATVEVKAAAKDAKGNTVADAALTGESTVGTFADGKFTAATAAGTGTLTLKVGDITKEVAVTITAGPVAKVVADKASTAPNTKLVLTAQDAYGNAVTGATFTDNSDDAMTEPGTGVFVAFKAGSYTVTATKDGVSATSTIGVYGDAAKLAVEVSNKLVANYNSLDATNKGSYVTVTVKAQDANGNLMGNYAQAVALSADNGALVIKGVNSGLATETAKNGSASFKVYAPAGLQGQIIKLTAKQGTLTDGIGNVEIVGQIASKVELDVDNEFIGVANAATTLGYTVSVVDQNGVVMRSGAWDTKVTVAGPATLDETNNPTEYTYAVAGSNSDNIVNKQYTTGAITLTATVEGIGTASKSVNAVFVGGAKAIALEANKTEYTAGKTGADAVSFSAVVKDSQGALVANDAQNVDNLPASLTLDLSALSADDFAAIEIYQGQTKLSPIQNTKKYAIEATEDANQFDTNEYKFTAITVGALTGSVEFKLTGKQGSTDLTASSATVAIKANVANKVGLTSTTTKFVPVTAPTTTVTVQLYDFLGNKVAVADKAITLTAYNDNNNAPNANSATTDVSFDGAAQTKTYKTDANGAVVVNVAAKQYVGNQYWVVATSADNYAALSNGALQAKVVVDSTATAGISTTVLKKVVNKDANNNDVVTWVTPSYISAGDTVIVRATVTDTYGVGRVANTNLKVTSTEKIFWSNGELVTGADLNLGAFSHTGGGVWESPEMVVGKAGVVSFTVTDKNAPTTVSADASVLAYAAAPAALAVAEADSSNRIFVTQNSLSPAFTLKLTDAYGNAVTTNANQTVYALVAGGESAKVVQLSTNPTTLGVAGSLTTRGTSSFYVGITNITKDTTAQNPTTITFSLNAFGNNHVNTSDVTVNVFGK